MAFIFGGDTGMSYEDIQRKRQIADSLRANAMRPAKNVGEGLAAIGAALAVRGIEKRAKAADEENRRAFNDQWGGIFGGGAPASYSQYSQPEPVDPMDPRAIAGDTMAALGRGTNKPLSDDVVRQGLIARGMPEHVADGFVMNFRDESGLNPGINEAKPLVPGSRGGFGLAQWTGDRRVALEQFAAQSGRDVSDPNVQMDFLMAELQGPEARAWKSIAAAPDAGTAGAEIVNRFLRPAEEHRSRRAAQYTGGQPIRTAQAGNFDLATLAELAGNPYASPGQKAVLQALIGQQATAMDPMRAMEMERARLELDAMRNPREEVPDTVRSREMLAQRAGLQPGTPAYQTYMATGDLPKEGGRPMTADERAAWNIPETDKTPYALVDGMPKAIGPAGTTINNNMDGGGKFEEAFAKGDAETINTVYSSGLAAQRNIGRIDQLENLLNASPTGFGAVMAQRAGEWGINTEGLSEIQAAQALINSLVPEQRQPGSGPMSDADLALFKQSLPRIINQPGGNEAIIGTMRAIAEYDSAGAEIAQRMRKGEIDRAEAFEALQNRPNPLANFNAMAGQSNGAQGPAANDADGGVPTFNPQTGKWE